MTRTVLAFAALAALPACATLTTQAAVTLACPVGTVLVAEVEGRYDPIPQIDSGAVVDAICVPKLAVE